MEPPIDNADSFDTANAALRYALDQLTQSRDEVPPSVCYVRSVSQHAINRIDELEREVERLKTAVFDCRCIIAAHKFGGRVNTPASYAKETEQLVNGGEKR